MCNHCGCKGAEDFEATGISDYTVMFMLGYLDQATFVDAVRYNDISASELKRYVNKLNDAFGGYEGLVEYFNIYEDEGEDVANFFAKNMKETYKRDGRTLTQYYYFDDDYTKEEFMRDYRLRGKDAETFEARTYRRGARKRPQGMRNSQRDAKMRRMRKMMNQQRMVASAEEFEAEDYMTDEEILRAARNDIDNQISRGTFYTLGQEPQAFHDGEIDGENFYTIISLYCQYAEDEERCEKKLQDMFKKDYAEYMGDESFYAEYEVSIERNMIQNLDGVEIEADSQKELKERAKEIGYQRSDDFVDTKVVGGLDGYSIAHQDLVRNGESFKADHPEHSVKGKVRTMSGKPHSPRKMMKDMNISPEEAAKKMKLEADMDLKESAKVGFGFIAGLTAFRVAAFGVAAIAGRLLGNNNNS
tara:strand:- start:1981 stop:3228 length:1248 start_codon:yes stop_codon:yes gene_type:complete